MRYSTGNKGQTVEAIRVDGGDRTEFVTRNASGETISTARVSAAIADALIAKLEGADAV